MTEKQAIEILLDMSAYAGERFDLVQAGGGNTSVKYGDKMLIKASGYLLSELGNGKGYTGVTTSEVIGVMNNPKVITAPDKRTKDSVAMQLLQNTIVLGQDRPSIETYLHALLYKYTCHVHSISVNTFTSHLNWEEETSRLFPEALLVPYETPGIELACLLHKKLEQFAKINGRLPKVIFLQNHGLIISSDSYEEITKLMEEVVVRAERLAGLDLSRYRDVSRISAAYSNFFGERLLAYLSEDVVINEYIKEQLHLCDYPPFSPDGFVFCGYKTLRSDGLEDSDFEDFFKHYGVAPKLIYSKDHLFIMAPDLKKAKMIEDVFKNNLLIAGTLKDSLAYLPEEEIRYLGNWEAEKYRQDKS